VDPTEPQTKLTAKRFLAGDPAAIAEAIRLIRRAISFRGFYVPESEREDVVQEVIAQLWQALAAPNASEPEHFDAFVRAVAYRRCVDWVRRHHETVELSESLVSPSTTPEDQFFAGERRRVGSEVLACLRPAWRELLRLHAGEGLTYRQIAERQGRLEKTVRNQMSECVQAARQLMERRERRKQRQVAPRGDER
jgi:RNA polymerase sigma factor (sigma-70 family)